DMDSTMIGQECVDELADYVGLKGHVAAITERAMRGEIAFEPALRERVALLKGLPLSVVEEVITKRITLTSGARMLVATMRAAGAGANDIPMLEAAGLGVAYHAKPAVAAAAHARIDHRDLTALLYCQGYARSGFIESTPSRK